MNHRLSDRQGSWPRLVALGVAMAAAGCVQAEPPPPSAAAAREPIIRGVAESGHQGIGALYIREGGMMGAICTATHIGGGWVVTAAHCVEGRTASDVSFVDGSNVDTGDYYPARSVHWHHGYVAPSRTTSVENDIALVEIAGISSLPTYELNTTAVSRGLNITWIGYGLNSTTPESGDGIKRRGSGQVDEVYWTSYIYNAIDGVMPCRGDSGGPALANIGGRERVVGIVSVGDENCAEFGLDFRIDAYIDWIEATMAGGSVGDCDITGGDCDSGACWPGPESTWVCYPSLGARVGASCDPDQETWTEGLPCVDGAVCMQVSEDPHDGECMQFCRGDGDCGDGEECYMPIFEDIADVGVCVPAATRCDILGGDCPSGEACFPTTSGENSCFPSDGLGEDASCNSDQSTWDNLPCGDGLICVGLVGGGGVCLEFCLGDGDCDPEEVCEIPIFSDLDDIGVCVPCTDEDGDGHCASDDCDDSEATAYPGATERCNDGIDNDCDGQTDEGCEDCTDGDGDGYCSGDDCDDGNRDVNPGAAELCADGIDNDCDGATDGADSACGGGDGDADADADGDSDSDSDGDSDGGGTGVSRGCRNTVAGGPATGRGGELAIGLLLGVGLLTLRRARR